MTSSGQASQVGQENQGGSFPPEGHWSQQPHRALEIDSNQFPILLLHRMMVPVVQTIHPMTDMETHMASRSPP